MDMDNKRRIVEMPPVSGHSNSGCYENFNGQLKPMLGDGYWLPRQQWSQLLYDCWNYILKYSAMLTKIQQWNSGRYIICRLVDEEEKTLTSKHVVKKDNGHTFEVWWSWLAETKLWKRKNKKFTTYTTARLHACTSHGKTTNWQSTHQGNVNELTFPSDAEDANHIMSSWSTIDEPVTYFVEIERSSDDVDSQETIADESD